MVTSTNNAVPSTLPAQSMVVTSRNRARRQNKIYHHRNKLLRTVKSIVLHMDGSHHDQLLHHPRLKSLELRHTIRNSGTRAHAVITTLLQPHTPRKQSKHRYRDGPLQGARSPHPKPPILPAA